jgi:hypothetical protein
MYMKEPLMRSSSTEVLWLELGSVRERTAFVGNISYNLGLVHNVSNDGIGSQMISEGCSVRQVLWVIKTK